MKVTVYNEDYSEKQGTIGDYLSCSVTWQWLGVGTGTLTLDWDSPWVGYLLRNRTAVVPVIVDVPEVGRRWSGRVANVSRERRADGSGECSVTLIDDWAWLRSILAWPVPAQALNNQNPAHYTATGPAVTVAMQLLQANIDRLGAPLAIALPASDSSPDATVEARFKGLDTYIIPLLRQAGWSLTATMWLPGDPQMGSLSLAAPTVVFRPYRVDVKPWLRWSDSVGSIVSDTIATQSPDASTQVLGGSGEEVDRVLAAYTDLDLQASLGPFGFPEAFADETQLDTADALLAEGPKHQAESAGTASIAITVEDDLPWRFGRDYEAGDVPVVELAGVTFAERIERVTATDTRADGLVFTPQLGDSSLTESDAEYIVRAVARITDELTTIQTGR